MMCSTVELAYVDARRETEENCRLRQTVNVICRMHVEHDKMKHS